MAIDFPASPTPGQEYEGYSWDDTKGVWKSIATSRGSVITSATTPTGATAGDLWFNTVDGNLFIYYDDGISVNWVEVNSTSSLLGAELEANKANLSGATFTGAIYSSFTGGNYHFKATNSSSASDQYNYLLVGANDTGDKAVHFVNSSTRTTDGGANSYTVRNDGGMLNLGNSSYNTNIYGKVTMPQQPVYAGSLNGTGSVSNYYPVASDNFVVGFSRSGNNRLTAQVAGKYYVYAQQLVNTSGGVYFHIFKNGSSVVYAYSNSDDTYDVVAGALVDLQVNDYVELYYGNNVSYSWPAPHSSYTVFKVS